ncbi:OmpA family protein [Puniceibacterium sp. IMCC21224]|uniref:OmpA family protein n=1 Tax=Puniceibacterium sp. IMCC21224 TaxID=1618204 RepID=UPI00064DF524|nr:OmpA family protein [Puniceibacterium sp. IMCC21224]KMK68731.1 outer membrane protein/peptidoglycan-associated (lipo)protein [Puniceibacterium sp. IMCC21224]
MRLSSLFTLLGTFVLAAVLSLVAAFFAVRLIEDSSMIGVRAELDRDGLTWTQVDANGLQLFVIGTAPSEALRFQALSAAGRVVDTTRIIDQINVEDKTAAAPPRFSIEILRNDATVSLIGLVPADTDRERLIADITRLAGTDPLVSDLLETADFPEPEGWDDALHFAVTALRNLPRSKISVTAGEVAVKASTDSEEARRRLESDLARRAPDGLKLAMALSAPRPVITPFTLRFLITPDGARFDACSANTEEGRSRILAAAAQAGLQGKATCTIGLGVPTHRWAEAVEMSIAALAKLGGESLTISNADVTLIAPEGTDPDLFDQTIGGLENALPPVFALNAVLPEIPEVKADQGPPEFTATLSPEGAVQLRGRINSEIARTTAESYAQARFGSSVVRTTARVDTDLPQDWSMRVLAGLEALAMLNNGAMTVTSEAVAVSGNTGNSSAGAEVAGLLSEKLGEGAEFNIAVVYQEKLDRSLGIPTPEECEAKIVEIIGDRKITFEPGAATLDASAKDILDEIAELLQLCGDIPLEIQGHTDSQGREVMNELLSQERSQAVLDALRTRRVLTASYRARGYGEDQPIADNGTESGREANRRIEFHLIRPDPVPETETTLETIEDEAAVTETPATEDTPDEQN